MQFAPSIVANGHHPNSTKLCSFNATSQLGLFSCSPHRVVIVKLKQIQSLDLFLVFVPYSYTVISVSLLYHMSRLDFLPPPQSSAHFIFHLTNTTIHTSRGVTSQTKHTLLFAFQSHYEYDYFLLLTFLFFLDFFSEAGDYANHNVPSENATTCQYAPTTIPWLKLHLTV